MERVGGEGRMGQSEKESALSLRGTLGTVMADQEVGNHRLGSKHMHK